MGGEIPKQFRMLGDRPVWRWGLGALMESATVSAVVLVVPPHYRGQMSQRRPPEVPDEIPFFIVDGGGERSNSVENGMLALDESIEIVAVHDAARPFPPPILQDMANRVQPGQCIVPALPVVDSVRKSYGGNEIHSAVDRNGLFAVQTPQVAWRKSLQEALREANDAEDPIADEAEAILSGGGKVFMVEGSTRNRKLTRPEDWDFAEKEIQMLSGSSEKVSPPYRVGTGHDIHRLVAGRPLILGGVVIPHDRGLEGHSDADAVLHALCDALLNALALGDIGTHFPDTDPAHKNTDSTSFVRHVMGLVHQRGWRVGNASIHILAEEPKLKPHRTQMQAIIAPLLGVSADCVGISAGTMEGMGPVGRREAIEVTATVLLCRYP